MNLGLESGKVNKKKSVNKTVDVCVSECLLTKVQYARTQIYAHWCAYIYSTSAPPPPREAHAHTHTHTNTLYLTRALIEI